MLLPSEAISRLSTRCYGSSELLRSGFTARDQQRTARHRASHHWSPKLLAAGNTATAVTDWLQTSERREDSIQVLAGHHADHACRPYVRLISFSYTQMMRSVSNAPDKHRVHVRYMSSSVRLSSVVCNVGAPYSGDWNFRQCFYAVCYLGHPWPLYKNFTDIVPGEPLRWGVKPKRVAKYSEI